MFGSKVSSEVSCFLLQHVSFLLIIEILSCSNCCMRAACFPYIVLNGCWRGFAITNQNNSLLSALYEGVCGVFLKLKSSLHSAASSEAEGRKLMNISYGFLLHEMHKNWFSWCLKCLQFFFIQLSFNISVYSNL